MKTFLILAAAAKSAAQEDPATGIRSYLNLAFQLYEGIENKKKKKEKPYQPYGYT